MERRKRILIVSYFFAPQNLMGAVRPTKLAKYLTRMGCEVTVICGVGRDAKRDPTLAHDLEELRDVHVIREWNPLRNWYQRRAQKPATAAAPINDTSEPEKMSLLRYVVFRIVDGTYVGLRWLSDRSFSRMARRELKKLTGPYDLVLSTYAPYSVHEVGRQARRSGLAARWVADFRDEVGMPFAFQNGRKERYMRMLRREADVLCAVSDGFLEMMDLKAAGKGRVLSNGFDREDVRDIRPAGRENRLRIVYCGQLLDSRRELGRRDVTPMFRALARLVDEGEIAREQLRLVYAGREGEIFTQYAATCGLEACVEDHGQVSREESMALQKGADILLMASHYTVAQRGILTGKLFEYLMMDKPIVCCMAGDLPGSGIKAVLEETGMGFCCEAAVGLGDEADLLAYVRERVRAYCNKRPLLEGKNSLAVEQYEYPQLARKLVGWMAEERE